MKRLLVTDLDGTLLDPDGLVHRLDFEAIAALRSEGVHVALCTGRLFSGTQHVAEELGLDGPAACVDGCHIVDARTGGALHLAALNAVELGAALKVLSKAKLTCFALAGDAVYYDALGADLLGYVSLWTKRCHEVELVTALPRLEINERVMALVALGPAECVSKAAELIARSPGLFSSCFEVGRPGFEGQWGIIVRSSGASKGTAVRWLAEHYGVARHNVVVVGDWLNDVPMFQWAEHAFAMAQAPDEVKQAASCVLDAHTSAGGGIREAAERVGWLRRS